MKYLFSFLLLASSCGAQAPTGTILNSPVSIVPAPGQSPTSTIGLVPASTQWPCAANAGMATLCVQNTNGALVASVDYGDGKGFVSLKGETGPRGLQGVQGPAGPQGVAGPKGATGATGPQGIQGAVGPAGANGLNGAPGPQGVPGDAGPAGALGPQGLKGDQGDIGPAGPVGPSAATFTCSSFSITSSGGLVGINCAFK